MSELCDAIFPHRPFPRPERECHGPPLHHRNRARSFLLPPSIDDRVEEGHQVRFLHDRIEQFDLSEFTAAYSREGGSLYDTPAVRLVSGHPLVADDRGRVP